MINGQTRIDKDFHYHNTMQNTMGFSVKKFANDRHGFVPDDMSAIS